jgi:hypothetical protein
MVARNALKRSGPLLKTTAEEKRLGLRVVQSKPFDHITTTLVPTFTRS